MLLSILAYFIIPAYTVLFVQNSNWLTTNFSVLGNMVGREEEFVLWGLLVGIYFFWCLRRIINVMPEKPHGTWLIPLSLILLTIAITTPYLPESLPLKSFLHIVFAFMAAVCLMVCLFFIIGKLYLLEKETYRPFLLALVGIALVSIFLLKIAGIVSSALEIFFTISTELLTFRLLLSQCSKKI